MSYQLIDSRVPDNESIIQQLDRLNQVLQSLAVDQSSEHSFYMTSDSQKTFSRFSEDNEDNYLELKVYKGIEEVLQELDRASMIREDFRSVELRNEEYSDDSYLLEVSEDDIELIIRQLHDLKVNNRQKVSISGKVFEFVLNKDKVQLASKQDLIEKLDFNLDEEAKLGYFESFDSFSDSLTGLMQRAYEDQFQISYYCESFKESVVCDRPGPCRERKVLQELEWKIFEVNQIKSNYQSKILTVNEGLKEIYGLRNGVKSKEIKLANQRNLLNKDLQNLKHHKKIIEKIRFESKKFLNLCESFNITPTRPSSRASNTRGSSESHAQIAEEIINIQQEISRLESIQSNSTSSTLQTKIDHLKTRQSNLRTLKVISASAERSNLVASRLRSVNKPNILRDISRSSNMNKENIIKLSPCKNFNNGIEGFESYIKLQESRLVEKEQEINMRESSLNKLLITKESSSEIVKNLMSEQRNLKIIRKNLEKQQKTLENEVYANIIKSENLQKSEQNLIQKISSLSKFIQDQSSIESRLQSFFEVVDKLILDNSRHKD